MSSIIQEWRDTETLVWKSVIETKDKLTRPIARELDSGSGGNWFQDNLTLCKSFNLYNDSIKTYLYPGLGPKLS